MQYDLFGADATDTPGLLPLKDGYVSYDPAFLTSPQADYYLACLLATLAWRQDHIKLYGKEVKIPRLQAWYGDADALYQYSGLRMSPNPWTEALTRLKVLCEKRCGQSFNSVLANCYRDGQDSMGWHSDNEAELGAQPVIASVSLGQARNFDFRHNTSGEKYRQVLGPGSLLLMAGDTQRHWQHGLAKTTKLLGPRVNLTFRYVFPTKA